MLLMQAGPVCSKAMSITISSISGVLPDATGFRHGPGQAQLAVVHKTFPQPRAIAVLKPPKSVHLGIVSVEFIASCCVVLSGCLDWPDSVGVCGHIWPPIKSDH